MPHKNKVHFFANCLHAGEKERIPLEMREVLEMILKLKGYLSPRSRQLLEVAMK